VHPTVTLDHWPSDDRATRIVFIVRNIAPAKVEAMLDALIAQAPEIEAGRAETAGGAPSRAPVSGRR
jgi:hypothetical protein